MVKVLAITTMMVPYKSTRNNVATTASLSLQHQPQTTSTETAMRLSNMYNS